MDPAGIDEALTAAGLLTGDDGSSIRDLAASAVDAIEDSTRELASITKVLGSIGDKLDAVPLIDHVAANISDGVDRVQTIAADLGDKLTSGGQTLVTFAAAKKR